MPINHTAPAATMLRRGLGRRCPSCGGAAFAGWWKLPTHCHLCGHRFERESGYWVGAVIFNTALAIVAFLGSFGLLLAITWPDVPWDWVAPVVIGVTSVVPILFYPYAQSLWMAYDLYVHPLERKELEAAQRRLAGS
jgi:uncharacterized protein (DUF983 family)